MYAFEEQKNLSTLVKNVFLGIFVLVFKIYIVMVFIFLQKYKEIYLKAINNNTLRNFTHFFLHHFQV